MLGRCCGASCPLRSSCAPRPFVSLARLQQQRRPWSSAQRSKPDAAAVVAMALGPGGRGSRGSEDRARYDGPAAPMLTIRIKECSTAGSLAQLVMQKVDSFNYINVSAALTKAAWLYQPPLTADGEACVSQLVQRAEATLADCRPRQLASIAWAIAKLGHTDRTFVQQLVKQVSRQLSKFNGHDTANALWALAGLGCKDEVILQRLLQHARKLSDFTNQGISNVLWAMAKLQHVAEDRQLVQHLLEHAQPQLSDFTPQALSNTAWALATLQHYDQGFMEQLLAIAQPHLQNFKAQELSNTAWALATQRHYDERFMGLLLQQSTAKVADFDAQHISNSLWALATFGHSDPAFVDKAVRRLLSLGPEDTKDQELSNALWALSMLQHDAGALAGPLFTAAEARYATSMSPAAEYALDLQLRQVHRYLITMEVTGHFSKQLRGSPQYLRLSHDCQAAFIREFSKDRSKCWRLIAAVKEEVRKLPGCGGAQAMQLTEDQQLAMDIGVTLPCNTRVAVEVTSKTACMANAPGKPLGPLLWKRKQLAARAYKVVVVNEADWLDVGPEMQQIFLRMRFREAGVVLPAAISVAGAA